jgi:hypothetical protein
MTKASFDLPLDRGLGCGFTRNPRKLLLFLVFFEDDVHRFDDLHVTVLFAEDDNFMLGALHPVEVIVVLLRKTVIPAGIPVR